MFYPKACFGCNRPHIMNVGQEVEVDGGVKVYHKDCLGKPEKVHVFPLQPLEIETEKIDTPEDSVDILTLEEIHLLKEWIGKYKSHVSEDNVIELESVEEETK